MTAIVLDTVVVDGGYVVRLVDDRDGDVVQVTFPARETLDEALADARDELMPYEHVVATLEPEEES